MRRVGLKMRGINACEKKVSINSEVGVCWLYWRRSRLKSPFVALRNARKNVVKFV